MMKRALPLVILALVLAGALALQSVQRRRATGYQAADFELTDLEGRSYKLSDLIGKVVVVNMWASWCPPCIAEMPSVEALYRRFRNSDLVVLTVSVDAEGAKAVQPIVNEMGLTVPVLLDSESTLPPRYGVTGYPETFVVDRDGRVVEHYIGPTDWASTARINYFQNLLRQPIAQSN